jgi:hypothetical protein
MKNRIVWYAAVPAAVGLALVLGYFVGPAPLRELVAPLRNRELGALENLENLLLLATAACCAFAARRERSLPSRVLLLGAVAASLFLFLEEIDYGHHFVASIDIGNIHNVGDRTAWFRRAERLAVLLGFVVLPLAAPRLRLPDWLARLVPRRESLWTLAAALLCCGLAELLRNKGYAAGMGLERNISEYEEAFVYALAALWGVERLFEGKSASHGQGPSTDQ